MLMRTMASSFLLTKPISSSASSASTNTTGRGRESVFRSCPLGIAFKTRREPHTRMKVTFRGFLPGLFFRTHLSSSISIIADVKNNSLSSFVQSHAGLNKHTHIKVLNVVRDTKATENISSVTKRTVYVGAVNGSKHH